MAEIRVDGEDGTLPRSRTAPRDGLEPVSTARAPNPPIIREDITEDPEVARAEIEHTRARMSETIDEIEDVLVRKKDRLQDRLDVLAPVRERPLRSAGIAFGVGLVLGLLTGGGDEDEGEEDRGWRGRSAVEGEASTRSARIWEDRARRLLRVAREQEEEIRDLQERYGNMYTREMDLEEFDDRDEAFEREEGGGLTGIITDVLKGAVKQMLRG